MHDTRATIRLGTDATSLAEAGRLLATGALVAFPTETVYGLGADATDSAAVARLYAAKGRPSFNPLIAHVPDVGSAFALGEFNAEARKLAEAFWPGPLTLVVPARENGQVCDLARAGLSTLAIRVPAHEMARAILHAAGKPIAAPSANRSGHVSPTEAAHVLSDLDGRIDAVVEGEAAGIGLESTILACLQERVILLRPGAITRKAAQAVIGREIENPETSSENNPLAPGRLSSHYATRAPVRLDAEEIAPGEACLAFGPGLPSGADPARTLNLSDRGDPVEAAANLYAMLRRLDGLSPLAIGVVKFSKTGLGEAIFDRLQRAAAPR
ncbi:MAG: L-threonylcarbamoyladenylate synthase [Beijerinckiaceae bacterium]|jgi:L-threonylcarbamoyladenylate synthase|nr:L-threonylcarbamoyladenylate synthase [Beijerinckiaceae bacterium]